MWIRGEWTAPFRKRTRALLTVLGMACGVFALVLMASLGEHFSLLAGHFRQAFTGRVYVCEKRSFWAGGGLLSEDKVAQVAAVAGVERVIPTIIGRIQTQRMIILGLPEVIVGVPPGDASLLWPSARLAEGRLLGPQDLGTTHAVLGSDVAFSMEARVGQDVRVLDRAFQVVGILAHTGALEDRQMLAPLAAAQEALSREGLLTSMVVLPSPPHSADDLARQVHARVRGVEVISPAEMQAEVERTLRVWKALTLGTGLVAAATGALCIVITMGVSVYERTYEIGLKKALGASNGQVLWDFVREALLLAVLGWAVGTLSAATFIAGWDAWFRREGLFLFSCTPRVIGAGFLVTLVLGTLAGTLPALSAARLDPVQALRRRP